MLDKLPINLVLFECTANKQRTMWFQSKLNCEVLEDSLAFEVRWAVAGDSIVVQLVAKLGKYRQSCWKPWLRNAKRRLKSACSREETSNVNVVSNAFVTIKPNCITTDAGQYMSFGVSADTERSAMVGGDVTVAWVDKQTLQGYAIDYFLDAKSQCSGRRGSCPDRRIQVDKRLNVLDILTCRNSPDWFQLIWLIDLIPLKYIVKHKKAKRHVFFLYIFILV